MRDSSDATGVPSDDGGPLRTFLRGLMTWSYDRGTLQYDIICALILAFIFFVPRGCFAPRKTAPPERQAAQQTQSDLGDRQLGESGAYAR